MFLHLLVPPLIVGQFHCDYHVQGRRFWNMKWSCFNFLLAPPCRVRRTVWGRSVMRLAWHFSVAKTLFWMHSKIQAWYGKTANGRIKSTLCKASPYTPTHTVCVVRCPSLYSFLIWLLDNTFWEIILFKCVKMLWKEWKGVAHWWRLEPFLFPISWTWHYVNICKNIIELYSVCLFSSLNDIPG